MFEYKARPGNPYPHRVWDGADPETEFAVANKAHAETAIRLLNGQPGEQIQEASEIRQAPLVPTGFTDNLALILDDAEDGAVKAENIELLRASVKLLRELEKSAAEIADAAAAQEPGNGPE